LRPSKNAGGHIIGDRTTGSLFETSRHTQDSPRRIHQMIKKITAEAQITTRVYLRLLRPSVATTLFEKGMTLA
jgi:site-specific recombinase XerD